ncbi:MAG: DUF1737 domain-containing protein, partial [Limisphaerales bacterium]
MTDRIKDYKLVQCQLAEDLEKDVMEHLKAGYELLGEPQMIRNGEIILY